MNVNTSWVTYPLTGVEQGLLRVGHRGPWKFMLS